MELYYTPEAGNALINIKESIIEKFDDENLAIEVLKKITKTARQQDYMRILFGISGGRKNFCVYGEKSSLIRSRYV